jgi:hypothetical protein
MRLIELLLTTAAQLVTFLTTLNLNPYLNALRRNTSVEPFLPLPNL